MKYKLIKTYPGSPELGTEVDKKDSDTYVSSTYLTFRHDNVEEYPEYWEKVNDHLWWCVWKEDYIQDDKVCFNAWTPNLIECIYAPWETVRCFFKTKEEAEDYILYNKPCLSIDDIGNNVLLCNLSRLKQIVKSTL